MQPSACPEPAEGAQALGRKRTENKPRSGEKRSYDILPQSHPVQGLISIGTTSVPVRPN